MTSSTLLWQAQESRKQQSNMHEFMRLNGLDNYADLYQWSINQTELFWSQLCDFCGVEFSSSASQILCESEHMLDARWFVGAKLNYAQHLLRHTGSRDALVFADEQGRRQTMSFDQLRESVAKIADGLKRAGVAKGDRVAAYMPNCIETVVAMLATVSLGAVWASCSCDFGANGIVDRFSQIKPKLLFAADGYFYNDKKLDCQNTISQVCERVTSINTVVMVPFTSPDAKIQIEQSHTWNDFGRADQTLEFVQLNFDHPLFIMFSSGTTGKPKCIVHGHGGTLIQHLKEHTLHCDLKPTDTLFYFTTCGWMMWNWLASGLACGAKLVLFDGSPFFHNGHVLWELAEQEKITIFGVGAKFLSAQQKHDIIPKDNHDLSSIQTILSTGSPLAPESFDYVYNDIKHDVMLSSISGGTDIISCFLIGNPLLPVYRGELQCRGLGMAVEFWNDHAQAVHDHPGELICRRPFPSAPICFWGDGAKQRYRAAYYSRFDTVWAQGDFGELKHNGGAVLHGRSDAVLNPGGVRIGTAEIYRQVETITAVVESIAIAQKWQDDVRIVLFVILKPNVECNEDLQRRIKSVIRRNTTPRHVPAKIIAVADIPRTKSGKIVELAVRSMVHGETIQNLDSLANPQALDYFKNITELDC